MSPIFLAILFSRYFMCSFHDKLSSNKTPRHFIKLTLSIGERSGGWFKVLNDLKEGRELTKPNKCEWVERGTANFGYFENRWFSNSFLRYRRISIIKSEKRNLSTKEHDIVFWKQLLSEYFYIPLLVKLFTINSL